MFKTIAIFVVYPAIIIILLFIIIFSNFKEIRILYNDIENIVNEYYAQKYTPEEYGELFVFYKNRTKIRQELLKVRTITDADGVSVLMFHNENKNFSTTQPFLITMLDEVTPPNLQPTTELYQNIPSEYIINPERKIMGFCIAYEVGNEDDNEFFNYLPPRILIGCPIYYNEMIVALLIAVKSSQSAQIQEFTSHISLMGEYSRTITRIINGD